MTYRTPGSPFHRHYLTIALASFILLAASPALAQNAISGIVFDPQKKPVGDIEIELLDGFERLIGSRTTTASGFYTFQRLRAGVYYLRVRPGSTNFKESKQRVDLGDLNALGGVDQKQLDLFLEIDERRQSQAREVTGVVFAQNVSEEARKKLERARKLENKQPEQAFEVLQGILESHPDYFEALELLGDVALSLKRFEVARSSYGRAVQVNPLCFGCFFNLGVTLNQMGDKKEAVEALRSANEVDAGSINANLLLGIVLRDLKFFEEAEVALLRARRLGKDKQPDVNWQLAELYYFNLNQPRRAVEELKRYLDNLTSEEKRENRRKIEGVRQLIQKIESES